MIERRTTVLDNRKGTTKKVFTSAPAHVIVELLSDSDISYSVKMTPMPKFQTGDYLLEVTFVGGKATSYRNLYGTEPAWASLVKDWDQVESTHGARLIASPEMSY